MLQVEEVPSTRMVGVLVNGDDESGEMAMMLLLLLLLIEHVANSVARAASYCMSIGDSHCVVSASTVVVVDTMSIMTILLMPVLHPAKSTESLRYRTKDGEAQRVALQRGLAPPPSSMHVISHSTKDNITTTIIIISSNATRLLIDADGGDDDVIDDDITIMSVTLEY